MLSGVSTSGIRPAVSAIEVLPIVSTAEASPIVLASKALPVVTAAGIVEQTFQEFLENIASALPKILTGIVFLVLSYVVIRLIMTVVRAILRRSFSGQPIYAQLGSTIVLIFLWFGALLSFLTAVGLGPIAASLGTASGFVALGVSYALSDMIKDAVAGVYLLRDPHFNVGDTVVAADTTGTIMAIELRKTRFSVDDDTVVRANAEVEKKWTLKSDDGAELDLKESA